MSVNTGWIPTNRDQHFLDCVETKNCDILLIDVINFKLQLINFVYFFETSGMFQMIALAFLSSIEIASLGQFNNHMTHKYVE